MSNIPDDSTLTHELDLTLSLSLPSSASVRHPPPPQSPLPSPQPPPNPILFGHPPPLDPTLLQPDPLAPPPDSTVTESAHRVLAGKKRGRAEEDERIPAPYPWATEYVARVHSLDYLLRNGIHIITGEIECKKCEKIRTIEYKLLEKFNEVAGFLVPNLATMHERAPPEWTDYNLKTHLCGFCKQADCCKPVLSDDYNSINWLFLFLGQLFAYCSLRQLQYFCERNQKHRSAAKDRVIYHTYIAIYDQLNPLNMIEG